MFWCGIFCAWIHKKKSIKKKTFLNIGYDETIWKWQDMCQNVCDLTVGHVTTLNCHLQRLSPSLSGALIL